MTQEEKELLLKDLVARLPYGVILLSQNGKVTYQTDGNTAAELLVEEGWKPYLRPMSSMTDEEYKEYSKLWDLQDEFSTDADIRFKIDVFDWLNKNHFDYRGLIPKDLAIEAPKEMYR